MYIYKLEFYSIKGSWSIKSFVLPTQFFYLVDPSGLVRASLLAF